jgi:hypothetical protein
MADLVGQLATLKQHIQSGNAQAASSVLAKLKVFGLYVFVVFLPKPRCRTLFESLLYLNLWLFLQIAMTQFQSLPPFSVDSPQAEQERHFARELNPRTRTL